MTPAHATEYRNETLQLSSLVITSHIIRGVTFVNCTLVGPAVIAPLGDTTITHCKWDASSFDALAWVIPDTRLELVGAIGLEDCVLSACALQGIGLAVRESQLTQARASFGG